MPLRLTIPASESWDYEQNEFVYPKEKTITLEHSLYSLAKWESKYHKPFMSKDEKTQQEIFDYIKFMTITQNVDDSVYYSMKKEQYDQINAYIGDKMTATWFSNRGKPNNQVITAEILYWQMIQCGIPFECEKWHLNRLLTLIRVCNEKSKPPRKMTKNEIYAQNAALNRQRRKLK